MFKVRMKSLVGTMLLGLSLSALVGCTAPEADKLGFEGEFCGSDDQCESTLVCRSNQCQPINPTATSACDAICERFVTSCGRQEEMCTSGDNLSCCRASCTATIASWRDDVIGLFRSCAVTTLSCEQAASADAINLCYDTLPEADAARQELCQYLRSKAQSVSGESVVADDVAEECRILARTGTDENWNKAAVCADASLTSEEFATCVNTVFPFLKKDVAVAAAP